MGTAYAPRHARQLPAIFRGLADLIEPAPRAGYRARHARLITVIDSSDRGEK